MSELLAPSDLNDSSQKENSFATSDLSNLDNQSNNNDDFEFKSVEELITKLPVYTTEQNNNFGISGFHMFDNWSKFNNIPAKITSVTEELIYCECLIDKEKLCFEERIFPRLLFDHITIDYGTFVLISIKSKIGSSRIDVYNGNTFFDVDLFNKNLFEINDSWKKIEDSGLDSPLEYKPE